MTAVIFVAGFIAAMISGSAGFGGALLLLPILTTAVGAEFAIPLLTVAQLAGNFSRAFFGFLQIQWKMVGLFLLGAIPCSIIGSFFFLTLPKQLVTRCIGAAIVLLIVFSFHSNINTRCNTRILFPGGMVTGFISGLIGSAGALGAAIFFSLGLSPVAYISSEATTAIAMHSVKIYVYQQHLHLNQKFWFLAGILSLAMVTGTWAAKRFIEKMPKDIFKKYLAILLAIVSVYMIIHG